MSEQRTMLVPGQGIVNPVPPTKQFEEYPKMMTHPGYQPGTPDQEIKVLDANGRPTGQLRYMGGTSIRFAPVLVRDRDQEEFHASQGYGNPVKSSPEAFARAVATAVPVADNYQPIEFPKWSNGKLVNNAEEEAAWLAEMGIDKDGRPVQASSEPSGEPAVDTEVDTLTGGQLAVIEAIVREAAIAAVDVSTETIPEPPRALEPWEVEIASLKAKIAELEAQKTEPVVTLVPPAEPLVMKEPVTGGIAQLDAMRAERARKMREGKARKKAEREAAATKAE